MIESNLLPPDMRERLDPIEVISRGSGGIVILCLDRPLQRRVVLKLSSGGVQQDAEVNARFIREAQLLVSLSDPRIMRIFDVGEDRGQRYLLLEHLEGGTIEDRAGDGAQRRRCRPHA